MIDTEKESGQIPALPKDARDAGTNPTTPTEAAPSRTWDGSSKSCGKSAF